MLTTAKDVKSIKAYYSFTATLGRIAAAKSAYYEKKNKRDSLRRVINNMDGTKESNTGQLNNVLKKSYAEQAVFNKVSTKYFYCAMSARIYYKSQMSLEFGHIASNGKNLIGLRVSHDYISLISQAQDAKSAFKYHYYDKTRLFTTLDTKRAYLKNDKLTFLRNVGYFESKDAAEAEKLRLAESEEIDKAIEGYHTERSIRERFEHVKDINALCFGFELEVECNQSVNKKKVAYQFKKQNLQYYYIERDGSIQNGFEIISKVLNYDDMISAINNLKFSSGMESFNHKTTGLHVHVGASKISKEQAAKIKAFVEDETSEPLFSFIAQRALNQYTKYEKKTRTRIIDNIKENEHNRYSAVNLSNYKGLSDNAYKKNTIEFRMFKGNLRTSAIKRAIETVHAVISYCADRNRLSVENFKNYVDEHKEKYPELNIKIRKFNKFIVDAMSKVAHEEA